MTIPTVLPQASLSVDSEASISLYLEMLEEGPTGLFDELLALSRA